MGVMAVLASMDLGVVNQVMAAVVEGTGTPAAVKIAQNEVIVYPVYCIINHLTISLTSPLLSLLSVTPPPPVWFPGAAGPCEAGKGGGLE